jgi:hypothetical protein
LAVGGGTRASTVRSWASLVGGLIACCIVFAGAVAARESLLSELAVSLRGTGVAVRTTWTEQAKNAAPKMPTLASLHGFPPTPRAPKPRASLFKARVFEDAALIAVSGKARTKASIARDLPRVWRRAPPSKRVYIAFARQDLAAANTVRRALEKKGYLCFIYTPDQRRPRWANPAELGRYYREAGVHLVLDSRAARSSKGVRFEAHAVPGKKPCCKLCYSLNGMLAGCDPVTCGGQCADAR